MSIQNFIPTFWQESLLEQYHSQNIVDRITYPVEARGGKLIINKMGAVTVSEYEGTVTYADLDTTKVEIPFDQTRYFAVKVADIDAVQACGDVMSPAIREGGFQLAKSVDDHAIAKIMASDAHATSLNLTKANVYEAIVDANRALDRKDIPNDRIILCGWDVISLLEKDLKADFHKDVVADGMAYRLNGVEVLPTNRVADSTVIVLSKQAVAYGMELNSMEALRLEGSFHDAVRALEVFAVEVVRSEAIEIVKPAE